MKPGDDLIALAAVFAVISLMAFGGVNAVLPEVHRQAVDIHAWVSNDGFTELYALSQAAPGPNMMIVTLIGWQVGGVLGAFVATVAVVTPSCVLAWIVTRTWTHYREARWRKAIEAGMIPLTVGFVSAGALVITMTVSEGNWRLIAVTVLSAVLAAFTRVHPLVPLAVAGGLGYAGLL